MAATNKQVLLAARPTGFPKPTDFRLAETPIPERGEDQFLVGISYLSVDPYMRGRMNATGWIDCYFENVGGAITDSVFPLMNPNGRVAICGQIALYNLEKPDLGAGVLPLVLVRTLTVKGFLVFQYARVRRGAPAACQMAPGGQAEISGDRS